MASYGSFLSSGWYSSSRNEYVYLEFAWEVSATSIENNYKTIYWELRGKRASSGMVNAGGFNVVIDGETVYSKSTDYRIELRNGTVIASGTKTFTHNSDGSRSFGVSIQGAIYTYAVNVTGSATFTLDTIPRVSSPTVSPSPVIVPGGKLTIKTNRKSDAFTHTLSYRFGNLSGTIATGVGGSHPWPVPDNLASQIPGTNSGYGTITCATYSGSTLIGSDTEDFTVIVQENDTTRPSVEMSLRPVNNAPAAFADLYIQGKSKLRASITADAWHSSIIAYTMIVDGLHYDGESTIDSDYLYASGTKRVSCIVKDGRGFYGQKNASITVQVYAKPSITDVTCCRCDADGTPDIYGRKILLKARRSWYSLGGKNLCLLRYRIRQDGGSWSGYTTLLDRGGTENAVQVVLQEEAEPKLAYQVELSAIDDLGETGVQMCSIGTANTPLHLGKGGRNLGLGRYCDYSREEAVDVGWPMYLNSNRILELPTPTDSNEAATKGYVDGRGLKEYTAYIGGSVTTAELELDDDGKRYFGIHTALGNLGNNGALPNVFVLEMGYTPGVFRLTHIYGSKETVTYSNGKYLFSNGGNWAKLWLKELG